VAARVAAASAQTFHPEIPRVWDAAAVGRLELPLSQRDRSPRYLTPEEYYGQTVYPIYRTYPVYAPDREPAGYLDGLRNREPEIVFDRSKLGAKEDWIRAGETIFTYPQALRPV